MPLSSHVWIFWTLASFNLDLQFAIPTQILNTESLGMTSHSMRRADMRNTTVTETNDTDHNGKTQNGEQWRKIRVQVGCRKKKEKNCGTKIRMETTFKKIQKLETNLENQRMDLEKKEKSTVIKEY